MSDKDQTSKELAGPGVWQRLPSEVLDQAKLGLEASPPSYSLVRDKSGFAVETAYKSAFILIDPENEKKFIYPSERGYGHSLLSLFKKLEEAEKKDKIVISTLVKTAAKYFSDKEKTEGKNYSHQKYPSTPAGTPEEIARKDIQLAETEYEHAKTIVEWQQSLERQSDGMVAAKLR